MIPNRMISYRKLLAKMIPNRMTLGKMIPNRKTPTRMIPNRIVIIYKMMPNRLTRIKKKKALIFLGQILQNNFAK
jgi:hypothetical protein